MITAPVRAITLLGTGHAVPGQTVSSTMLDARLGLPAGTVEQAGGVRQRHFACRTETAAQLAVRAATQALAAAGLALDEVDCLVAASGTMDQAMPCNAALIYAELRASKLTTRQALPAFDVNASCLGFLAALETLSWAVAAGRYRRVLIVAADIASCGLDWQTLEASAIFGDGAAAAVIGPTSAGGSGRILASELQTLPEGAMLCQIPAGGSRHHPTRLPDDADFAALARFRMDGKGVFRLAAEHLPAFVARLLAQAGLTVAEIDWVVPHQASHLALSHLGRRLGFSHGQIINIFADHGNQIAASLPTALDIAIRDGRIRHGQRLLLLGTGAGLSLGGCIMVY